MSNLRFPHYIDFSDWCKEHMSDIIERFPKIDESIEFEDIEVDNVYILRYHQKYETLPNKFHAIYIVETRDKSGKKESGYHYMSFHYRGGKWRPTAPVPGGTIPYSSSSGLAFKLYHIIPISSNDFSFINWPNENPLEVK